MSLRVQLLKLLLEELSEESKQKLDWSDIGFTAEEESRLNLKKPKIPNILTPVVLVDPSTDPMSFVAPASSAADKDPVFKIADTTELQLTLANKTSPIIKHLHGYFIAGTAASRYMTLEQPAGTDYQVPASKELHYLSWFGNSQAAAANDTMTLGYGDDAVAEGTTPPTNLVQVFGNMLASVETVGIIGIKTAGKPERIAVHGVVPAEKYPCVVRSPIATQWTFNIHGIEVDV